MRYYEIINEEVFKIDRDKLAHLLTPAVLKLGKIYKDNGYDIRLAGGAVRDFILGKQPKDLDLATDCPPEKGIEILNNAGIKTIPTGLQHGTISAIIDKEPYEITTLRVDVETDGRHAKVEFTKDWEIDSSRRDLSWNSMFLDLDGNLYDYHNGVEDLKNGITRFVGNPDDRITEDGLRILRFFRFSGRMPTITWDNNTLKSIKRNASILKHISGERIWAEMSKILTGNHVTEIVKQLFNTNVAENIGLPNPNHQDLDRAIKNTNNPATILASFAKNEQNVDHFATKWKLSTPERELIRFIVHYRDKPFDEKTAKMMWTDKKMNRDFILELAYYLGKNNIAHALQNWQTPVFPVTGKDLQDIGVKPGPEMGKILASLNAEWKDSGYTLDKGQLLGSIK